MSHIVQLDISEETSDLSRRKLTSRNVLVAIGIAAIVLLSGWYFGYESYRPEPVQVDMGISLTEDWYYDRELMGIAPCPEPEQKFLRNHVNVGFVDRRCQDVESCVDLIQSMADKSHFFISIGHVFEGLGWQCNVTDSVDIKFLGVPDQYDDFSFYKLLRMGVDREELTPSFTINLA